MSDHKFDQLLSDIRNEHIDEQASSQAGERVWSSITGSSGARPGMQRLQGCEDFQSLIPVYLGKNMTEARKLLFEDHIHQCVACRHAVEQTRSGRQPVRQVKVEQRGFRAWQWTMGVAAAMVVAFFAVMGGNAILGRHAVRGSVQSVDGSLYTVADGQVHLIPAGFQIRNGDEIRTAKGSNVVVRLLDGSLVEMGERAELSVSREWRGTTIHLGGGHIIVQAAKQRNGRLYVATGDSLVSVKGTIFSVNRGTKGSRVAVIEGVVRVAYGNRTTELNAGDESTSNASVSKVPIREEIAWSRNSDQYLGLLGDFAVLQKQFEAIPGPGLRYSSDLLPYVPDHAIIYAAIPNLANTLSQASQIFQYRLQQSPALNSWWQEQQSRSGPKLGDVMNQLQTFSSYLGDEIVFAAAKDGTAYHAPVVLARVRQSGLEAFLQSQINAAGTRSGFQIVEDPQAIPPSSEHRFLVYVGTNVFVASPDAAELRHAVARIQQSIPSSFTQTPFYQQILRSYQHGVGWYFCADMEQMVVQNVQDKNRKQLPPGMGDVRYLMLERRDVGGKPLDRAVLTFASDRHGVAAWLAAPASMGSLEFISPDASVANSVIIKNPKSIMEEMFNLAGSDQNFVQKLSEVEAKAGVNLLDDVAAPLGGEATFAFDGPVVPTPTWKVVVEVYDPVTLQSTIGKLVDSFNREATPSAGSLQLTSQQVSSQTYYTITNSDKPAAAINYTYVDGYLIAGPDVATLSKAIRDRAAGHTLTHSATFQALLPSDGYTNFSGIFYHNLGPLMGTFMEGTKAAGTLTPEQQQSIATLQANTAPGLIYAYGEPQRIVVASNGGFDLGILMAMGHGGASPLQMLLQGNMRHANSGSRQ